MTPADRYGLAIDQFCAAIPHTLWPCAWLRALPRLARHSIALQRATAALVAS